MSFCQICRHDLPGHFAGCPVGTGEPVLGFLGGISQQDMQPMPQAPSGSLGQMGWAQGINPQDMQPMQPLYGVSDTDHRILLELADIKRQLREIKEMLAKERRT